MSNRVSRRQANRWSQQDEQAYYEQQQQQQQYAEPPPPPPPAQDPIAQLKELAELKDQGILTEAEFAAQKAKILGS